MTAFPKADIRNGDVGGRAEQHELLGEVLVVEEDGGVFAYPKLNAGAVYSLGAEEPLPELYTVRIRLS
jgi:hypothetical protein